MSVYDAKLLLRDVPELKAGLRLPTQGLGPLPVPFSRVIPGQFDAGNVTVPLAGEWQLTLTVRVNDFDSYTTTVKLPVR